MSSVPHLSSVLLTGPLKSIRRAVDVLNAIDEAGPIVFIELLVVEYLHGDTFDWSYNLTSGTNAKLSAASINPASVTSNLAFTYNFVDRLTPSFKLNLNALVTKNFAKVVTNPHMAVRHGEDGVIALTEEQYVTLTNVTSTFGTTLTLQQINAGVTLKVNPKVVNGRLILLDLTGEVAVFLPTLTGQYSINRNTITSKVTVTDDQTLIIGGLIKEKDNREENRTPFLGHVPILGWLFKSTSTVRQFSETVMYITPHIGSDRYFREGDMLRQVDAQITQLNERDKVRREKLKSRKKKK
jgi:type II secretory pathway component GspD/PulD (secretin)